MADGITKTAPSEAPDGDETCQQMARIICPCGFEVVGFDEAHNRGAFNEHPCPNRPAEEREPWYGYVFSFWGFAIIAAIFWALAVILGRS